ncbi:hypothetical protein Ciccas_010508, partial [Cichlidogyrus casuarinus]
MVEYKAALESMNAHYRINLAVLMQFLNKVAANSKYNLMDPNNLALVIGPNLFQAPNTQNNGDLALVCSSSLSCLTYAHDPPEGNENLRSLNLTESNSKIVQFLIVNANELFPEKIPLQRVKPELMTKIGNRKVLDMPSVDGNSTIRQITPDSTLARKKPTVHPAPPEKPYEERAIEPVGESATTIEYSN